SVNDRPCRDRFIRQFGLRTFRRPLTTKEVSGYGDLFSQAATRQRDFLTGAKVVVEAMLQSPSFIFHLEDGPAGESHQYGVASRRFKHLVWDDANFMEMFTAGYTFLPTRLAPIYGLEPPAEEFAMVKYPAGSTRAGVLGHAGLLTLTASQTDTSPTARGLFVR